MENLLRRADYYYYYYYYYFYFLVSLLSKKGFWGFCLFEACQSKCTEYFIRKPEQKFSTLFFSLKIIVFRFLVSEKGN